MNRFVPLRSLGWAFLLAWVFCVFYTGAISGYVGRDFRIISQIDMILEIVLNALPVFVSILMIVVIVGGERRLGSPTEHKVTFWLAPLCTACATPLLFWPITGSNTSLAILMFGGGSILVGVGSGLMWVMWGEYYARISQELVERLAPISAIIAAILVLILSSMSGWIAIAIVTMLPILSGLCFYLAWKDLDRGIDTDTIYLPEKEALNAARTEAKQSTFQVLRDMGRTGLGILVACLFTCVAGSFWSGGKGSFAFQIILLVSILFTASVAFASTIGPQRITIAFLYRWMCPALVLAFVAVIVFPSDFGEYLAYMVSIAVRFAFCLITQMYFARYASQGKATAIQSFGLGWLFVHFGDFLGLLLYSSAHEGVLRGMITGDQVAALSIAIMVIVTMFVLNDKRSFATEKSDTIKADSKDGKPFFEEEVPEVDEFEAQIIALAQQYNLTPREKEVLGLLARGRSVPYIRDVLFISKETAATHVKRIYAKMGVHSRQELIDLAE